MLADLIKRVEEGAGADRELDGDIFIALSPECQAAGRVDHEQGIVGWWPKDGPYTEARAVAKLTASLDAVEALIEDKLPGTEWEARRLRLFSVGRVWDRGYHDISSVAAEASSPARALLAAALKAIEETRR